MEYRRQLSKEVEREREMLRDRERERERERERMLNQPGCKTNVKKVNMQQKPEEKEGEAMF